MRAKRSLRAPAAAQLAVGALALAMPATALAVSESSPSSTPAAATATPATTTPSGNGVTTTTTTTQAPASVITTPSATTPGQSPRPARIRRLHTALDLSGARSAALVGTPTEVRGRLLPDLARRRVELEARLHGRWIPVAAARTSHSGRFALRYRVGAAGSEAVRVIFAGDRQGAAAISAAATVTGLQDALVSWYYDAGDTACGFHATYGIASRTLPCGTHVTMSYGSRTVVATVDDRGPFVYSREYDLNQNVAAALGMTGVATILASV